MTLVSPNGEYGGPVRVALNQARALREAGHEVVVAGGARGFGTDLPHELDGVPLRLFPARTIIPGIGFAGLCAPDLQQWLKHAARSVDIVHIHAARDLVTLPAARWLRKARIPYVMQTHGMIDPSRNPLAFPLDLFITRPALRGAKAVFYLTDRERTDLGAVAGQRPNLVQLANGVPQSSNASLPAAGTEVLYLARLARRKRPQLFVEMALALAEEFPHVLFTLVGPDEGEGPAVQRLIDEADAQGKLSWEGPLAPGATNERLARATVYVLPSVDEPYPMSVLEAMSVGVPVVITDSCGLAPAVSEIGCGIVVDDSLDALIGAVAALLRDGALTRSMGQAGALASRDRFGMPAIAEALARAYR
ncbi:MULTISPECIES: glycosyltransferase [Cryobacterium]|uniref:glycosyltransferase n=1 Tax=Cryobacterium TaxID=69578 RepID=UPI001F5447F2|nr:MULTISPECIES: glycosyltransferase [Cryobacterium]